MLVMIRAQAAVVRAAFLQACLAYCYCARFIVSSFVITSYSIHYTKLYDFFEAGDSQDKKINRGRLVHDVLSRIETADQLEKACEELVFKGMMTDEEADEMQEQLSTLLADPEVASWFDGSYRILNA